MPLTAHPTEIQKQSTVRERNPNAVSFTLLVGLGVMAAVWFVVSTYAVPHLIESAYNGQSLAIFNRLIKGQANHSVAEYLATWRGLRWQLFANFAILILIAIVVIRPEFPKVVWGPKDPELLPKERIVSRSWTHVLAFVGYFVLAALFTLPTSIHPSRALLGDGTDNYLHSWFLWNFARTVVHGHNPFRTDLILYPYGVNLAWAPTDPLVGVIMLPVTLWLAPAVTYNLALILQLTLAAFFARLLCLRISRNPIASTIGGMIFGFSPYMVEQSVGHLASVTAFPIPVYALALGHLLEKDKPSWKEGVLLGLALWLVSLGNYQYVVLCIIFTGLILAVDFGREGVDLIHRTIASLFVAGGTFCACFSPLLFSMLHGGGGGLPGARAIEVEWREKYSADLFGFLIPNSRSSLFGSYVRKLPAEFFASGHEGVVYIGILALVLVVIGAWSARAPQRIWAGRAIITGLVFMWLALGPTVHVFGRPTILLAPGALVYKLGFMRFIREPGRFSVMATLCVSLLATFGLAFLLEKVGPRWQRYLVVGLVALGMFAEYNTLPFHSSSLVEPDSWAAAPKTTQRCTLPSSVSDTTVLTVPLFDWIHYHNAMWMQMLDGGRYRLVDGHASPYVSMALFDHTPIVRVLLKPGQDSQSPAPDREFAGSVTKQLDLGAVVVFDAADRPAEVNYVREVFGVKEERVGTCAVFELPRVQNKDR